MRDKIIMTRLNEIEKERLREEGERQQCRGSKIVRRLIMTYLPYSTYEFNNDLVRPGRPFVLDEDRLYE